MHVFTLEVGELNWTAVHLISFQFGGFEHAFAITDDKV